MTQAEIDSLKQLHKRVVKGAQALVTKLRECEPAMSGMSVVAHVHGFKYNGPTYGEELKALEVLLLDSARPAAQTEG